MSSNAYLGSVLPVHGGLNKSLGFEANRVGAEYFMSSCLWDEWSRMHFTCR